VSSDDVDAVSPSYGPPSRLDFEIGHPFAAQGARQLDVAPLAD
jgi:hypothetical protein